ncbi:MAG: LamG domain-containing protein, partial [Bacteroidales bacterium]|nr:LamG domain-containing protein [Bacteroidales bacterium]
EYDITDLEKREGDLSVGLVGGDPSNQEGDVDVEQELDYDETEFYVKYMKEDDTGYFLGIDGHGRPGFRIRVNGVWEEITSDVRLDRRKWHHVAATYSGSSGKLVLFVDGRKSTERGIGKAGIELSAKDIQIGRGKPRRPTDPVRENTFPGTYSFDGLIDEVKIYDVALSPKEVGEIFSLYSPGEAADLDERVLPAGENRKQFGGYYTNLKFYDSWDHMWRFGEHSDVVVEFDNSPCKFVFWKGVSYIPMMVNDNNFWYSNEFNETWSTSGGEGCQEPMSDKQCLYNHVRIIENTPARVVVHYRFPLVDVIKIKANYVEETGWYDVADWYYYIYPDGVAAKLEHLWTSGPRIHEWQESMAIFGPDQHPHDLIEREETFTIVRTDGAYKTYDWNPYPPDGIGEPEHANIHHINYKGEYDPVTIVDKILWSNVYGGEITEYAIFPTWNHWPVAQMPSDGRYASYPDRTCHSSLSHIFPPDYSEQFGNRPYQSKIFLEGMLKQAPLELIPLAKSWIQPALLSDVKGCTGRYDRSQRAYVFDAESDQISMTLLANEEKPVENVCMVFKHWNTKEEAVVSIDGMEMDCKQGIIKDTDGTYTLVVWAEKSAIEPFRIEVNRE